MSTFCCIICLYRKKELRFFDNRTSFSSAINILCSIGVTVLLICIVIAIIVVIEKMVLSRVMRKIDFGIW